MNLYLVRHAEAADKADDPKRNLTARGMRDAQTLARMLRPLKLKVGAIWHSGKPRAVQTAEIVASALAGKPKAVQRRGLKPDGNVKSLVKAIARLSDDLMIVGHEPFLGKLAAQLVCGADESCLLDLEKPSIVCIRCGSDGVWKIVWLLSLSLCHKGS